MVATVAVRGAETHPDTRIVHRLPEHAVQVAPRRAVRAVADRTAESAQVGHEVVVADHALQRRHLRPTHEPATHRSTRSVGRTRPPWRVGSPRSRIEGPRIRRPRSCSTSRSPARHRRYRSHARSRRPRDAGAPVEGRALRPSGLGRDPRPGLSTPRRSAVRRPSHDRDAPGSTRCSTGARRPPPPRVRDRSGCALELLLGR